MLTAPCTGRHELPEDGNISEYSPVSAHYTIKAKSPAKQASVLKAA
jgi:hypothetical protein